jgi:hypothetical protein
MSLGDRFVRCLLKWEILDCVRVPAANRQPHQFGALDLAPGAGPSLMAPGVLPGMRRHAWS